MEMLKTSLEEITKEIISHQKMSVFEIGRRIKYVKENDLTHGEFGNWLKSIDINKRTAQRMMQTYEQFGNTSIATELKISQITEMLTLPQEIDREEFATKEHTVPSTSKKKKVADMTVKELREVVRVASGKDISEKIEANTMEDSSRPSTEQEYVNSLLEKIRQLEDEKHALQGEKRKLASENRKQKGEIDSLKLELSLERATNRFGKNSIATPYELLGIEITATKHEMKQRYRALMKAVHPDHGAKNDYMFKQVQSAYEKLVG
ncbi:DUF3102 domain-containing protein [Bacillus sp. JJ722]|uniref:DUF3102 domain-containing protein n=1 Tax=Bacillus sp. JJ722 TaxID=3122973 RepID=UPI003000D460